VAAAEIVKALAAREGRELRSHGELHKEIARLTIATGDDEISVSGYPPQLCIRTPTKTGYHLK